MTKDKMQADIRNVYLTYAHIFSEAKISVVAFGRWNDSFKLHADVKKVYNYIFGQRGLFSYLVQADLIYRVLAPAAAMDDLKLQWKRLQLISKNQKQVVELRDAVSLVGIAWRQKPKRKRSNE